MSLAANNEIVSDPSIKFPAEIEGNVMKMFLYAFQLKEFWNKECEELENDEMKSFSEDGSSPKMKNDNIVNKRRGTVDVAGSLRSIMKKTEDLENKEKINSVEKIGLLRPNYSSKKFEISKTLATINFGKDFFIQPNIIVASFLMLLFIVCYSITFLAIWHILPSSYIYALIGCWPFMLYLYIVCFNLDIAVIVLNQQQTWVFYLWDTVFYVIMLMEYVGQDYYTGYVLGFTTFLIVFITLPLLDTITDKKIKLLWNKIGLPICLVLMLLHYVALFQNWSENDKKNNALFLGAINMSILSLGSSALESLSILTVLNVFFAFIHPNSMAIIKSRVEAVLMSEEEATVLRAMYQIEAETVMEASKKYQVKPDGFKKDVPYITNSILEYPVGVKGKKDKMLAFALKMKQLWMKECNELKEKKGPGEKGFEKPSEFKDMRRDTSHFASKLKVVVKKEDRTNATPLENDNNEKTVIGLLRASFTSLKYDPKRTLATLIFGQSKFVKPNLLVSLVLMTLFSASVTVSFLAVWRFIPSYYIWFVIGGWPGLINFFVVLFNTDVALLVLQQQQTWVFFFWNILFFICMLVEYKNHDNYFGYILFWTTLFFSFICGLFLDSISHLDIRMICNKLDLSACIAILVLHQIAMYYNWSGNDVNNNTQFFGHINMNVVSLGTSALNNLIIMLVLNVYFAFKFPHSMIMIKSRVEAVIVSKEEALVLRALEQIENETADANKQQDILAHLGNKIRHKLSDIVSSPRSLGKK